MQTALLHCLACACFFNQNPKGSTIWTRKASTQSLQTLTDRNCRKKKHSAESNCNRQKKKLSKVLYKSALHWKNKWKHLLPPNFFITIKVFEDIEQMEKIHTYSTERHKEKEWKHINLGPSSQSHNPSFLFHKLPYTTRTYV